MARLRKVDCSGPGIRRRRRGKGFEYLDDDGKRVTEPSVVERIRELAIPPAWEEVWICPYPMGHIQATGTDAAGRKQYRYHDKWRERRDAEKFEEMLDFARALPRMRERVDKDIRRKGMPREKVLAAAMRLLDRGFFRIGSENYAEENDTYGIATMGKRHVTISDDQVTFDYEAKGGKRRVQSIGDPELAKIARVLKKRRGGGEELLAYKVGRRWVDVKSADINGVPEGGHRRRLQREGLPHLERHGARRGGPGRGGDGIDLEVLTHPREEPRGQGGRRATSATRRRSAARRTSTRACSIASTADSRSAARSLIWSRTRRRGRTCSAPSRKR